MTFLQILTLIIIGLSLSVDAFTLSLAYGLLNISKGKIYLTSLLVGFFHFLMPILGDSLGNIIRKYISFESKHILIIVLSLILVEMIKSLKEEKKEYNLSVLNILVFALLVSMDSFSLGIGINYITSNIFLASGIFSFLSGLFTFLGFKLGKYLSIKAEKQAKYIGITILFTVIIYFLCKH